MLSGHSSLLPLETLPDKVKIAKCLGVLYTHRRQKSLAEVTDTAPHLALSQVTLQKTLRVYSIYHSSQNSTMCVRGPLQVTCHSLSEHRRHHLLFKRLFHFITFSCSDMKNKSFKLSKRMLPFSLQGESGTCFIPGIETSQTVILSTWMHDAGLM